MAVNDTWVRNRATTAFTQFVQDIDIASVPVNDTMLRVHGSITVILSMPAHTPHSIIEGVVLVGGIYTTLTSGGTLLAPASQQADFAPPLQRWLWWENMHPEAMPSTGKQYPDSRQVWRYTPAQQPIDIKSQVKATSAIDLHLAIQTSAFPANLKQFDIWWWFSMLRSGL